MANRPAPERPADTVGAFVPHSPPPIAGQPQGPLAGLSFAVKDLYDLAGYVTGGGSPAWLASHAPAAHTSPLVTRLLEAGADMLGKTVCDEFFYSIAGENAHYGTPRNVNARDRIPGGSSSGSAAAVAARLCDFALGSDTGGSVRVPAAFCGLHGLRPSHGRVDLEHAMAMAPSFDTAGWFTRGATLSERIGALLLDAHCVAAPVTQVLIARDAFVLADDAVRHRLQDFITAHHEYLPARENIELAPQGLDVWRECMRVCQGFEVWQQFGAWISATRPTLGPGIRERMEMASRIDVASVTGARAVREQISARVATLLTPGTVVLLPSAPCIAPRCNLDSAAADLFRRRSMALTASASLSGHPQLSLPAGTVEGCPVGLSLLGWRGGDEALLALSVALSPS